MVNRAKLLEAQKEHGDELVRIRNKVADGTYRSSTIPEVEKRQRQNLDGVWRYGRRLFYAKLLQVYNDGSKRNL